MIVDNIRKTIRATQSAVKRFGMSRVLFPFLLIVLSISSLAGSVVTHSYHSLMAYMIASRMFFNNSSERRSYSLVNPFS